MHLGVPEIIAILLVILLLFGPGRIEKLAGEMGKGIRSFREGMQGKKDNESEETAGEEKPEPETNVKKI